MPELTENGVITLQPPAGKRPLVRILDRVEMVDLTEEGYPGLEVQLWVNPPDDIVQGWTDTKAQTNTILAAVIRGWNLCDAENQPQPVAEATIKSLPSDVIMVLNDEFWRRRNAPLVRRLERGRSTTSKASDASSTPPTPSSSTPNV